MQDLTTIALAAILAFIPAIIAREKGRNFGIWWLYGFLLFIVALIHSIFLQPQKACVFCGKNIHRDYTLCPYCGKFQTYFKDLKKDKLVG